MARANRFPIGTVDGVVPPMLGREQIMIKLSNELTGVKPANRSVVAPHHFGKSVFMKELAERVRVSEADYVAVVEWDLGHSTPRTDEEFLSALCSKIGRKLKDLGKEDGNYLIESADEINPYDSICAVVDDLEKGEKILVLLDGLDKPLTEGKLTRHLWDNLRELCQKSSFRLVTASRKELFEINMDEKSRTSDFWNIFGTPLHLEPYSEEDINSVLESWPELKLDRGARTELYNWTGNSPLLLLSVLNHLPEEGGMIDSAGLNAAAEEAIQFVAPYIRQQYSRCSAKAQDLRDDLSKEKDGVTDFKKSEAIELESCGFAKRERNKLFAACRLLDHQLEDSIEDRGSLAKLFGSEEKYKFNIINVLERRIGQIEEFDDHLFRYVVESIRNLRVPDIGPGLALAYLSSIEDRALTHIWNLEGEKESDDRLEVPTDVANYWIEKLATEPREKWPYVVKDMNSKRDWRIPKDRGPQLQLLKLLTGSHLIIKERKAIHTSKDTYVLLEMLVPARNRAEHVGEKPVDFSTAVVTLFACVELLSLMAAECPKKA